MVIKYNTEQLTHILEDIFILTGISIDILDADYNSITTSTKKQKYCSLLQTFEIERKKCAQCDKKILERCRATKKLESHICRTGLYDSAMPIIKYGTIVGFIIMGQVRSGSSPDFPQYIPDTDPHTLKKLNKIYQELPFISQNRLEALYDLMPHILFNNAIEIVYNSILTELLEFINANLQENLSVNELCQKFHISKNYLYDTFQSNLNNTVTGYINEQRIKRAKELLRQSNHTVYKIGEMVGVDNYTYFCKLFKKLSGVTPTEYRRKNIESFI